MAGLIEEILFMLFPFIMLYYGLKFFEYKVYWLMDFLLINSWACAKKNFLIIILSFEMACTTY